MDYNQDFQPRTGGVFEPTHGWSLVNQKIRVNKKSSFVARFPNVWSDYKLPRIEDSEHYENWLADQMVFWQMQLNFAVWAATSGCGVSKEHLTHRDPFVRSVWRFHAYYQIRRILSEMSCPLPTKDSWNPLQNGIDKNAYERICAEFGISTRTNWRQKFDRWNGMGTAKFTRTYHKDFSRKTSDKVEIAENPDTEKFEISVPGHVNFLGNSRDATYPIWMDQMFDHDPDITDVSIRKGDAMAAIGSFVMDRSSGFTRAGVIRINDSVRTLVWAILGAQSQTKTSILGYGSAFDAQKQFLANVEDAINSVVDLPDSIERYQENLLYARSKLDFVIGHGLYMLPSNMELEIGTLNGYNNFIQIASDDMSLGYNSEVNDQQSVTKSLQSEPDDFQPDPLQEEEPPDNTEPLVEDIALGYGGADPALTHDEKKLSLTLGAALIITTIAYFR